MPIYIICTCVICFFVYRNQGTSRSVYIVESIEKRRGGDRPLLTCADTIHPHETSNVRGKRWYIALYNSDPIKEGENQVGVDLNFKEILGFQSSYRDNMIQ